MGWFAATDAELARQVLQRGVAAVFVVAFVSSALQFPALLGERGLLPVPSADRRFWRGFTLFRWGYTDRRLAAVCWTGVGIAALLVLGLPQTGPDWLPMVAFLALWFLYMSVVNVGGTFYGFGWESLLLEAGFTVAFLGSNHTPPPRLILLAVLWLVFRLEFGAGLIKLRGDVAWRDLTALYYHHETQPMPNPFSRLAHLAPRWWHRLEVLGNHVAQLVAPVLLLLPQPIASIGAAIVILTQLWLVVTGNFAWLNWLTIVLGVAALGDAQARLLLPVASAPAGTGLPTYWLVITTAAAALLLVVAYRPAVNLLSRNQLMNASFNRWHLGNAYGAFGSVTRDRDEVIIEGAASAEPGPDDWREYGFFGKPGDPKRRPGWFAPYHLRLDWLLWFVPLGAARDRWFAALLLRLLEADPQLLKHVRVDPFGGRPPALIRVRMFRYRFANRQEHRETGAIWIRRPLYTLVAPVGRRDLERLVR
jgi:hypothetical protein